MARLKSCSYCNKIHSGECDRKPKKEKKVTSKDRFRWTQDWQNKREEIKERDNHLCQVCLAKQRYTYDNLSVHHILPLETNYELRLDNFNLITLCLDDHELAESGEIDRDSLIKIAREQEEKKANNYS